MMDEMKNPEATHAAQRPDAPAGAPSRLSPEAERALAEADARHRGVAHTSSAAHEVAGRGGLDPVRYGDWEIKGLTSDF